MARQDYILRLIEAAGEMLIRLRKRLLGGETGAGEVEAALEEAARKASVELDLLRSVSLDTLVMLVSPSGEPEPGRTWITAEMFLLDGIGAEAEGDRERARDRYERALRLYALLDPGIIARGMPEVEERTREVVSRLEALDRP